MEVVVSARAKLDTVEDQEPRAYDISHRIRDKILQHVINP
jgi:hypothetical protein